MKKQVLATLALTTAFASAFVFSAGAASDKQVLKDENGKTHNVIGKLGKASGKTPEERTLNALEKVKSDFGFASAKNSFKEKMRHKDENGVTHAKLSQVINGIPVFAAEMIVHENEGEIEGITGTYQALTPNASVAAVDLGTAISNAVESTGFNGELTVPAAGELVYFPQEDQATLSYQVNVKYDGDEPGNWIIFVDALDGSILEAHNNIHADNTAVGTGKGVLGDTKSINTYYVTSGARYYLRDKTKPMNSVGGEIQTFNAKVSTSTTMSDTDNIWTAADQAAGVDAHFYAGKTYDYYYGMGRNSINNRGMTIKSVVHYGTNYNNAFWDGTKMTYGDGDGVTFRAFSAALDVVAHELTHGVTEYTSGLIYSNQSGALNESWSDVAGAVVDADDWLCGEDIYTPNTPGDGLRDLANPAANGQPAHMSQYVYTSSDNGGVHTNSGIPNKAFYNFATAIGSRTIAGKIWYVASRDYMTASTNFSGARAATLQATAALYGSTSSYYTALQNAWTAVGVN